MDYRTQDIILISKRNNYDIVQKWGTEIHKLKLQLMGMESAFGVNFYQGKHIINFTFIGSKKNNAMMAQLAEIQNLDRFFRRLSLSEPPPTTISTNILETLRDKTYMSPIKERPGLDPLIRCHLRAKGTTISTRFTCDGQDACSADAKGVVGQVHLDVASLWVKGHNYGLIIYVDTFAF